ncbi:MAG: hypothetical protein A3I68_05810 [Candidatus Melainabacteria bacterium RIFCSPLOWO2_02_FULL_35_15]|nr:MAG: hypothetical protein A3F80_00540 [Candidatus Melainabacteria bacterium RIFCSPLOWO2_12_FULL_35_11]OGI13883.1 MAG: hypothetical protein A3I68_05810 [Candidatus Melainabacteria bacterium RIFCSPLOWO2_02_FULL_35_15]
MIPYNEALSIILANSNQIGIKSLKLTKATGYILAEDISTKYNIPFFDNSAVDGFGVRISDIVNLSPENPAKLRLIGTIQAGDLPNIKLLPKTTIKILTGAPIPDDVETVVMKEYTKESGSYVYLYKGEDKWKNIRREGEEFRIGSRVLSRGTLITPPVIGLLATLGCYKCPVYLKPKISIIVTGNELIKPGKKLSKGKIYESNSYALVSAFNELGIYDLNVVSVKDDKKLIKKRLKKALRSSDIIVTVGGISVGDYDFVKDAALSLGVQTLFTKVAIKPAKPNYFGTFTNKKRNKTQFKKLVFGLPGNPVSALISFQQLIKPALLKIIGARSLIPFKTKATLTETLSKKPGRLEFVRGILEQKNSDLLVQPTKGQGSHMLGGIANANCLIYFPQEQKSLAKGEKVNVELLSWN